MNQRELERAIEREVESWPGVTVEFVAGGKHPKAKFTFEGMMLSRPYAGTPSDGAFGLHNALGDMRRVMKQLGATRAKPEPTREEDEAPYRKPNDGAAKRPDPVKHERAPVAPDVADQLVSAGVADRPRATKPVVVSEPESDDTQDERAARIAELEAMVAAVVDGIYFGLADEIYHAVPALGSGSIAQLLTSPGTFWRGSWLDPDRPELDEEATNAQILGRAYHCARLEPDMLETRYCCELDKTAMPKGTLFSGTEMGAELEERGLKKSGSVLEQARRLAEDGFPEEKLWHLCLEQWKAALGPRQAIPAKYWKEILIDMERIRGVPAIADLLSGGAAEVSIFWTDEHGLRCKARIDYLTIAHWADFKTFANAMAKRLDQAIADAFRYNRYYVQAVHYRDAIEAIRSGALPIRGPSTDEERELIAGIVAAPAPLACWYVFQEKGGIPNLLAKRFRFTALDTYREHELRALLGEELDPAKRQMIESALGQRTGISKLGEMEIARAKQQFLLYSQVYAPGEPWAPIDPMGAIDDADFHPKFLEGSM
jgi:hypothetical protein